MLSTTSTFFLSREQSNENENHKSDECISKNTPTDSPSLPQLRLYEPEVADAVISVHLIGLSEIFERVLQENEDSKIDDGQQRTEGATLDRISQTAFEEAMEGMPCPPPGLGYGEVLIEARPRGWSGLRGMVAAELPCG